MKAVTWCGTKKVSVDNVPDPKILNARDAIVKVTATTICGSDLHLYNGFMPSMQKGDILGHEFMGEVVELGKAVTNLKIGDRVVVPFAIACGNCEQCQLTNFSCCENSNPTGWMPEKLIPTSAFMPSGSSAMTLERSHQGRNSQYFATSVTSAYISSALYQMRTLLWTVFIGECGPARAL